VLAGSVCAAGAGAYAPATPASPIGMRGAAPAGARSGSSPGVEAAGDCAADGAAPRVTVDALSGASVEARCAASPEGEVGDDAAGELEEAPGEAPCDGSTAPAGAGVEDDGAPRGPASAGRLAPSGTSGWSDLFSLMTWGQARGARTNEQGLIIRRTARRRHPCAQLLTYRHIRRAFRDNADASARRTACRCGPLRHPAVRRRFRATRSASTHGSSRTSATAAW